MLKNTRIPKICTPIANSIKKEPKLAFDLPKLNAGGNAFWFKFVGNKNQVYINFKY